MGKFEKQSEIDNVTLELRSLMDECKKEGANLEEIRSKKAELENKRFNLVKELAQMDAPAETMKEERSALFDKDAWLKAVAEKRSLTIGNTGAINQIKTLVNKIADKDDILAAASFYYGANASTLIPVLAPLGDPADYAEGATNVSVDTDAGVVTTEIAPKAYSVVLPITAEALTMNTINLEAEVPAIFEKAFRKVMHKGMMNGLGTSKKMSGIFTIAADSTSGATVTNLAASQTAVKISDLVALALTVAGKDEDFELVMNPTVYSAILSDSTSGEDVKLYKEELIRNKSIEGVKVRLDTYAPRTTSSGDILVVACPLSRYAIGVAGEMTIDAIKVKGDTNTYFQATMFFGGKQVSGSDLYAIAVA